MDRLNIENFKTQIDVLGLSIDSLDDDPRAELIQHLEETLSLLKLGSQARANSTKKLKLESDHADTDTKVKVEDVRVPVSVVPTIVDEESVRMQYEGLIPMCAQCDAKFPSLGALDKHTKIHDVKQEVKLETNDGGLFKCTKCTKAFMSKKSLTRHKYIHNLKHQCTTCGKGFHENRDLLVHTKNGENCMKYLDSLLNSTKEVQELQEDDANESNGDSIIEDEPLNEVEMRDEKDVAHQVGSPQQVSSNGRPKKLCELLENTSIDMESLDRNDMNADTGAEARTSASTKKLCEICNIKVYNSNFSRHRAGIAHKELEIQRQMGIPPSDSGVLVCRKCNVSYNTFEKFRYHLKDNPSHKSVIGDPEPETDMDTKVVGA